MISLQRSMHSSQMYTPGPAMSFLTCFWLLPQKEHLSRSPPSPMRATGMSLPLGGVRVANYSCRRSVRRPCPRHPLNATPAPLSAVIRAGSACWGSVRAVRRGAGLAAAQHLVDESVLDGLLRREDLVPLDVVPDLLGGPVRMPGEGLLQPGAHPQHLVGLDLDVGGLAVVAAREGRLVDEHPGVGQ